MSRLTRVAMVMATLLAGGAVELAGQAGVMPKLLDSPALGVSLPLFGVALINSRRDSAGTADQKSRRRRLALVIAGAVGAAILGAAVVISLQFKAAI